MLMMSRVMVIAEDVKQGVLGSRRFHIKAGGRINVLFSVQVGAQVHEANKGS